ncbi:MAG: hypothetical protein K2K53_05335, partial [Oscillospiraceae bacterium]|nr:hypothetical protein [Oscillospiraceae bacterium]
PDIQPMRLPEAAITLVEAIYDISKDPLDHELLNIARDGVISENELERFAYAMDKLRGITAAAIVLASVPRAGA